MLKINDTTTAEFVRLSNNEPLTLICSSLADFLWEDFLRESRPIVKYLHDKYNIRQLSRFGKELFDRLHNADQVTWLVTEQDVEDFFRQTQNGESPSSPKGYKAENAFWWAVMQNLTAAPGWPSILSVCVGDQFNSGNNAVSILNNLSEAIEQAIQEMQMDVAALFGKSEEMQSLRDAFNEAKQAGDKAKAEQIRNQAKQLSKEIHDALEEALQSIQPKLSEMVDKALDETKENQDALSSLAGDEKGQRAAKGNLAEKKKLADKLKKNKGLQEVCKRLGTLKRIWGERKRAKRHTEKYEGVVGAKFSNEVPNAFGSELAMAIATPESRALFALRFSQRSLLTKDFEAHVKDLGKGPIIMYVDVSGSMCGAREVWSKAIAFVIAHEAAKENREVHIHLYDSSIDKSTVITPNKKGNSDLIDFVCDWHTGGGTSYEAVLQHALKNAGELKNADYIMITDGDANATDVSIRKLNVKRDELGAQWTTIVVDKVPSDICHAFSDKVHRVDASKDAQSADAFQDAIR